ncbi:hypothetical protein OG948_10140 [Embleya sp. NBC_00888]|uniref:hypothetical protein n=1 Tax=Embleya sp. NBC_00888 TaxID=2975960 RepID=UPI00386B0687|nr:hypothetical protein OG948_10140 [Embleya sp. NBC_00888]
MTAAQPTPTSPIDLDGYTGAHAHDFPLHRERGFAFFAPPPEGTTADPGRQLESARRDKLLFDLASWHHDIAPTHARARAAAEHAHEVLRTGRRREEAPQAVRTYACARSDLLTLLDRRPMPRGAEPLYEHYVPAPTRIDPTTLPPEADLRRRAGLLRPDRDAQHRVGEPFARPPDGGEIGTRSENPA